MEYQDIPGGLLDNVGTVAVVLLVGWMLVKGILVTRRELERAEHDRDEWRAESRLKDQQIAERDAQLGALREVGETMKALIETLQKSRGASP